jgi:putative oxidoreductase
MRDWYQFYSGRMGIALLILRVVVGAAFVLHGLPKVSDASAFAAGLGVPTWLGVVAAWTEVIGGATLALGLLTPLTALFLVAQMIGALAIVHLPQGHPFVSPKPGAPNFELAAVYLAVSAMFLLVGPGGYSLDHLLFRTADQPIAGRHTGERGIV